MHSVTFIGTVSPEQGCWWIENTFTLAHGLDTVQISVQNSAFNVHVTTPDGPPDAIWADRVWRRTEVIVRSALDSLGFHRGASLDIKLVSGIVDNGAGRVYLAIHRPAFVTPSEDDQTPADVLGPFVVTASRHPSVRLALADIREAMRLTEDCAFYCFRAIESMRQHFLPDGEDDRAAREESWGKLRDVLDVDRAPIDEIRLAANARRHGGTAENFDAEQAGKYVLTTRGWMARFVEHVTGEDAKVNI
ncbi:hypothetical protein SBE55_19985 [Mycolicibacterium sp. 141076]|uniref:hypothetical protein n=1 Tax=Mycobacteriaceae TaxID=1762 RepID=UPI00299DAC8B|nr:hypothetical protein [Mycolicibacterium sp. 141076]MDX1880086.1 hypothetical protein [Mycolicibacterium sp. 141076]